MTENKGLPPIVYMLAALVLVGLGYGLWRNRDLLTGLMPGSDQVAIAPDNGTDSIPQSTGTNFRSVETQIPTGSFNYGGSTTWAPIRGVVDPLIQGVWPEFRLRYTDPIIGNPGSGSGIRMLLDNQLSFAHSSRSLKPEEYQEAEQRGFTLEEIPVAIDAIAIAVHPSQTAPGLTVDQIRGIYQGTIINWQQVGGSNQAITPYSRRLEAGGTVQFFVENVLGEDSLSAAVKLSPDTTQALRSVARDPGGIYYASVPELVPQCTVKPLPIGRQAGQLVSPYAEPYVPPQACPSQRNRPNMAAFQRAEYPITRRLFVIVKRNGQADEQAGNAYAHLMLTQQGQDLVEELGFVRLR